MTGVLVYYITSPVHLRNVQLLAQQMPDWTFRPVCESPVWHSLESLGVKIPFEMALLANDTPPPALWFGDVRAVIFSTIQARPAPINLLREALIRSVPTIAIEESNQLALNMGIINNYVLPVDFVLAASEYERSGMISAGASAHRVEVTGWPFYSGHVGNAAPERVRAMKTILGIDPNRPVASLTLTGLNNAGESPTIRQRQLSLAAQGLPLEYQLVIKPHPTELLSSLAPFVQKFAPRAKVLEGSVPIHELLTATDVLLNRGASQVCIEALLQEIPVIVLETGILTPFHILSEDIIVEKPADIAPVLARFSTSDPMRVYAPFLKAHIPISPHQALEQTCRRITEIATAAIADPDRAGQWFELALYHIMCTNPLQALEMLGPERAGEGRRVEALKCLVQFEALRDDLEVLREAVGDSFLGHMLRSWWIEQLARRRERPLQADLAWMQDFPPAANVPWFVPSASRWLNILIRSGESSAALSTAQRLENNFIYAPGIPELVQDIKLYVKGCAGRSLYFLRRALRKSHIALLPAKHKLRHVLGTFR